MQSSQKHHSDAPAAAGRMLFFLGAAGCIALATTFLLATSDLGYFSKASIFAGVTSLFVLIGIALFLYHRNSFTSERKIIEENPVNGITSEIESKLLALDDANRFFGASLQPADMFMLISSRITEIFPFSASLLLVPGENAASMKIIQAGGKNADEMHGLEMNINDSLTGRAAASGVPEIEENPDSESVPAGNSEGFRSSAAIPLIHDQRVFGVLQLFTDYKITADEETICILEAIGEHAAPIFKSSFAFEESLSNALTDPLTNFPNQRALFVVLESQVAESQRFRERPLAVLAIDIKDFSAANLKFGHATGDRILVFTAKLLKEHLRKMDFLARSVNDEYLAILPTAPEKTALDIVERIKAGFAKTPFKVSEGETINVRLNFGWATFWKDGEIAQQLLQNAQLRKQQAKSAEPNKVLWFPKEYVN